jgi:DNA invertase Pin-like site-specific DNA recombinase
MNAQVAIYARVSTTNDGQDVRLQTGDLRELAEARGWRLADEYVDSGVSGSKDSRPELKRLMADAKRRKFDVVLVWTLDRFGRSLRHLVNALAEFESLGIAFVSLSDNLDLSTASGRLMFNIIGAMAEFERELIRERVKAGMKNAKAKGARIGRPRANVDIVQIARLRESGASLRDIAARLGVSAGTVATCSKKVSRSAAVVVSVGSANPWSTIRTRTGLTNTKPLLESLQYLLQSTRKLFYRTAAKCF